MNHISGERIAIEGTCTVDALESCLRASSPPAVIMDVEGYEAFLLDPARGVSTYVLAEMHDCVIGGMTVAVVARMEATHDITKIVAESHSTADIACRDSLLVVLPQKGRMLAVSEERPERMTWLWMKPKTIVLRAA